MNFFFFYWKLVFSFTNSIGTYHTPHPKIKIEGIVSKKKLVTIYTSPYFFLSNLSLSLSNLHFHFWIFFLFLYKKKKKRKRKSDKYLRKRCRTLRESVIKTVQSPSLLHNDPSELTKLPLENLDSASLHCTHSIPASPSIQLYFFLSYFKIQSKPCSKFSTFI